ncbi:organic cation transporter protein-like [Mercenaria mercenaria]|uniref:organic cation transporter protein-like n=1 Tax=Mercenaria mercenaria TaxID=6596 RepID=UPI00234E7332|nr:organic cation transporter protein-like [Mercenaria mercenaria]
MLQYLILQWSLVCDDAYLSPLSTTIYFFSVIFGGLVFGHIADMIGRKPVLLLILFSQIAVGMAIFFMPWYTGVAVLRFVQGVLMQVQLICHIFWYFGIIDNAFFASGMMFLSLLAYLIRDWCYLQLAISLPSLLAD